jgi:hypothetical protein
MTIILFHRYNKIDIITDSWNGDECKENKIKITHSQERYNKEVKGKE